MKRVTLTVLALSACLIVAEGARQSFVRKLMSPSLSTLREEYCRVEGELLDEAMELVADLVGLQRAVIGDVRAFVQCDGAPCDSASKGQLEYAAAQTRALVAELDSLRQRVRDYANETRLFCDGPGVTVVAAQAVSSYGKSS